MYKHMIIWKEKGLNELLGESVCLPNDSGRYILFTSTSLPSLLSSFFLPIFLLLSFFLLSFPLRANTQTQTHTRIPPLYLITPTPYFNFVTSCISTFPSFLLYSLLYLFLTFFPFPPPSLYVNIYISVSLSLSLSLCLSLSHFLSLSDLTNKVDTLNVSLLTVMLDLQLVHFTVLSSVSPYWGISKKKIERVWENGKKPKKWKLK